MMSPHYLHHVDFFRVAGSTKSAYLIDFGGGHEVWLPRSQVSVDENQKTVSIPNWLYEKKFRDEK